MANRKLGRTASHRRATMRSLVCALFIHDRIETTMARAKEARRLAEKLITLAGEDSQHRRLKARRLLNDKEAVKRLFDEIGPRFRERPGGYTRILRLGPRRGDNAPMVLFELVD